MLLYMFTVQKRGISCLSDFNWRNNSWSVPNTITRPNTLSLNIIDTQMALTDVEVQKLMNPVITGVATRTTMKNRSSTLLQIQLMKENTSFILSEAAHSFIGKTNRSILDILKWAYWPKIAGWSIVGDDIAALQDFTKSVLQKLQSWEWKTSSTVSSNDPDLRLMA